MPLNKSCSLAALEENIAKEVRAGRPAAQAVAIAHRTLRDACREAGKPVPTRKADDEMREAVAKRQRTREFLEEAFKRARKVLNPRDYAVIFQAARGSAGGQISARNRRDRMTSLEKHLLLKAALCDMTKAELLSLAASLGKAYDHAQREGNGVRRIMSRAESVREECHRRGLDDPAGPLYVELGKRGKADVRKEAAVTDRSADPGVMVALRVPRNTADAIAIKGGERPEDLHVTLCYVGRMSVLGGRGLAAVNEAVAGAVLGVEPIEGTVGGIGRFAGTETSDGKDVIVGLVDAPGIDRLRHRIVEALERSGLPYSKSHGYVPHITLDYVDRSAATPGLSDAMRLRDMSFNAVVVSVNGADEAHILGQPLPLRPMGLPDVSDAVEMVARGESIAPPTFVIEAPGPLVSLGVDVGDLVEMSADGRVIGRAAAAEPDAAEDVERLAKHWLLIERHTTPVPFVGPADAPLMFVAGAPNELELARKQALVGEDALTFEALYLRSLGLTKRDVAVGFAVPVLPYDTLDAATCERWSDHIVAAMKAHPKARVVALGRPARDVLKAAGVDAFALPHPSAVRRKGDSGEVSRKVRAIAKALDLAPGREAYSGQRSSTPSEGAATAILADAISGLRKTGRVDCRVIKAADEKQIVYGVVLDPYAVDLQGDWIPPAEIESTAHGFLEKSRVIGFEHVEQADAKIVESWVEAYPTRADYEAALDNRPHQAFARKFGSDVIHSGAWVAGVRLGDREWKLYKEGKLNAFSVGGFSFKTRITTDAMPQVEFVELIAA